MTHKRERHPQGQRLAEIQDAIHGVKQVLRKELAGIQGVAEPTPAQLLGVRGARAALGALRTERDIMLGIMESRRQAQAVDVGTSTDRHLQADGYVRDHPAERVSRSIHPMVGMHVVRAVYGLAAPDEVAVLQQILGDETSEAYIIDSDE